MDTKVTFEKARGIHYAVVQKGRAKKIVSVERGHAILEGTESISFVQDTIPKRRTKRKQPVRRANPARSLLVTARLAMGLSEDDTSIILCTCGGNKGCTKCYGIGVVHG